MRYEGKNVISNSMLTVLKESPKKFCEKYVTKVWTDDETKQSLQIGSLTHCMVLEPAKVHERFAMIPQFDKRTKKGKAMAAAFKETSIGKEAIEAKDWETAERCTDALMEHDSVKDLIGGKGIIEKPIYWKLDGVDVAGTPDYVDLDRGLIVDVKTTQDASPTEFARSVRKYGYHRQAWMYTHGIQEVHGVSCRFFFAVVETARPFHAAVYELPDWLFFHGGAQVRRLLQNYQRYLITDRWLHPWEDGVNMLPDVRAYESEIYELETEDC